MLAFFCTVTFPMICYYPNMHARSLYKQYDYVDDPIIFFAQTALPVKN